MKTTSRIHVTTFISPGVSAHKQLIPEGAAHEGAPSLDVLEVNHSPGTYVLIPHARVWAAEKYWHFRDQEYFKR